jgi:hypothetical protein
MQLTFNEIEEQALRLSPEDRARLAESLLASLSDNDYADTVELFAGPAPPDRIQARPEIARLSLGARRGECEPED